MEEQKNQKPNSDGIKRRDLVKGLATIPVLGAFAISAFAKYRTIKNGNNETGNQLVIHPVARIETGSMEGDPIRIGIIGFGFRGEQLARALGYGTSKWEEQMNTGISENPEDSSMVAGLEEEDLNVKIVGICDTFSIRSKLGQEAGTRDGNVPELYSSYQEMLASPNIDAVIIATPDHWHAPMSIAAIKAGKHVYVENAMTHKVKETYELYDAVKSSDRVFQLGHQRRQTQSFLTVKEIIRQNSLGHVSLIQATHNRNDENGAWQYDIHENANIQTIDWNQFLGNAKQIPFSKEHYFRWKKWWEYGSGIIADSFTHDFDKFNYLLKMGIPSSVVCSGGIYNQRDGRSVPDVLQIAMEYPDFYLGGSQEEGKEEGMTFMYSATLGNQFPRPTLLMGHDATMELGSQIRVYPDANSTRYKQMLESDFITPNAPMYVYNSGSANVDGYTGATIKSTNLNTYSNTNGTRSEDLTFLHLKEWLSAIRNGHDVSCGIEEGFEATMAAHMAAIAYRLGKRIEWDASERRIANVSPSELESIGMI